MRSLSQNIGLGYFLIICINNAISTFAIYHINDLSKPIDRILKEKYQNVSASENILQALSQQELVQLAMIEDGIDTTFIVNFKIYKNELLNWHQRAIEGIALPSEPEILDSLINIFDLYLNYSDSLQLMLINQIEYRQIKLYHFTKILPLIKQMESLCSRLKTVNENAIAEADQKSQNISSRAKFVIIIFSAVLIALSILASYYFTQRILKPVKETTDTVRKISRGKLNQKVAITTDDEIAELGIEFNRMTERLDAYERMNINQILKEKNKSEALVANIPVAIIVTDQNYRLTLLNDLALKILNLSSVGWIDKAIANVVKDTQLINFLTGNEDETLESVDPEKSLIAIKRDNEDSYFMAKQIKLADANGKLSGFVTLLQDVTSFKKLDRLKSEFIATISHELKTPLTSMNMAIDILSRGVLGELTSEQKELLQGAKNDGQRLKNFIKDLLDISKLESGNYVFNYKLLKVNELIEHALNPLIIQIKEKNIKLDKQLQPRLPNIKADFEHISRVITNLIENAIQHTNQNGLIFIKVETKQKDVEFCVEDNGEGIPDETKELIFDKFVQVKNFQDAEQGNIGLGLSIAREIVRAHSGKIWVESEEGKGSKFYFQIPTNPKVVKNKH